MTATSSRFADFEKRSNRAFGHVKVGDGFQPKYQRLPDAQSPKNLGLSDDFRRLGIAMIELRLVPNS